MFRLYWRIMLGYNFERWALYDDLLKISPDWPPDKPWPIEQNWIQMRCVHSLNVDYYSKKLGRK